jgi:hypothetical protein
MSLKKFSSLHLADDKVSVIFILHLIIPELFFQGILFKQP